LSQYLASNPIYELATKAIRMRFLQGRSTETYGDTISLASVLPTSTPYSVNLTIIDDATQKSKIEHPDQFGIDVDQRGDWPAIIAVVYPSPRGARVINSSASTMMHDAT
jgi:hypothetical protein